MHAIPASQSRAHALHGNNRYGQLSGMVEPIGGVLGAAFVHFCRPMLPFTMSLAAGAMIYVVCDSLVPEMQAHGNKALAMQVIGQLVSRQIGMPREV